jgi:hypothetical protein
MSTAGYSGTPLAKRLGIREGAQVYTVGAPANYPDLLSPLPDGVVFQKKLTAATHVVHLFTKEKSALQSSLRAWRQQMSPEAAIWVSWPKKASKVPTDITEDTIREVCLPLGLVDVKVCAVDEIWSGLKLVVRKDQRG